MANKPTLVRVVIKAITKDWNGIGINKDER